MSKNHYQYIDLYREQSENIKRHSADLLNSGRDAAFERFVQVGFPTSDDELYRNLDLSEQLAVDYGLNINRLQIPVNPSEAFRCNVPSIHSYLYYVINDRFYAAKNSVALPDGVIVGSLSDVARCQPELVAPYFARLSSRLTDGFTTFNAAFAQDGFFIYIPDNVILEHPVQIVNIMRSDVDFMANSHNIVIIGKNAKAQILVCDHTADSVRFFENRVTEVFVGENAVYEHYKLENTNEQNTNVSTLLIKQNAKSEVLTNIVTLHNGITRNTVEIDLDGEHCQTALCGMVVTDKTQNVDNHTVINHNQPNCHSSENFKYVLNERSSCGFTGKILVAKDAQKTAAYQSNKNLLLTRDARIRTRPTLEIYADDVKCSHGATTGQLDEQALFYLRQRGISCGEARLLLLYAFTADIVENVKIEGLRERLKMMIEKRLRGESSKCDGCTIC